MSAPVPRDSGIPAPSRRLQGRRILITGAASGIGRSTAELFAGEGAALTLLDRDAAGLAAVASASGGHAFVADVTDENAVARAVQGGAAAMGGIDGIVNVAGIAMHGSAAEVGVAQWRRVIDVNLTGMYVVVHLCLPWLSRATGATIVNLGSGQSLLANAPNRTAYAASKGGVLNLSRALAAELAPAIRVNCVCPGLVDTPMIQSVPVNVSNYAMRRVATPLEVAQAILFLSGPESSFVTGAALAVDGGRSFH